MTDNKPFELDEGSDTYFRNVLYAFKVHTEIERTKRPWYLIHYDLKIYENAVNGKSK